ncbi:unnamed protein product, partial [marine sediment metagenome]
MIVYGFCASFDDAALVALNLSSPTAPSLLGVLLGGSAPNYLAYPRGIVVDYPYAYVVDGAFADGFNIYDISDPSNMVWVGGIHPGDAQDPGWDFQELYKIIKSGNTVYITSHSYGLFVVDVTDVTAPIWTGSYTNHGGYHMALSGTTLYVSASGDGFAILDVSNPAAIV